MAHVALCRRGRDSGRRCSTMHWEAATCRRTVRPWNPLASHQPAWTRVRVSGGLIATGLSRVPPPGNRTVRSLAAPDLRIRHCSFLASTVCKTLTCVCAPKEHISASRHPCRSICALSLYPRFIGRLPGHAFRQPVCVSSALEIPSYRWVICSGNRGARVRAVLAQQHASPGPRRPAWLLASQAAPRPWPASCRPSAGVSPGTFSLSPADQGWRGA